MHIDTKIRNLLCEKCSGVSGFDNLGHGHYFANYHNTPAQPPLPQNNPHQQAPPRPFQQSGGQHHEPSVNSQNPYDSDTSIAGYNGAANSNSNENYNNNNSNKSSYASNGNWNYLNSNIETRFIVNMVIVLNRMTKIYNKGE